MRHSSSNICKSLQHSIPFPVQSVQTLADPYHKRVPLPRIPDNRAQDKDFTPTTVEPLTVKRVQKSNISTDIQNSETAHNTSG